jgi:hypothetical protein
LSLFSSDIIPPKGWENVVIECKKRAKIEFRQFADTNGAKQLNEWIEQVYNDNLEFKEESKIRMVVFAPKFAGMYCCYVPTATYPAILDSNFITYWYNPKIEHYPIRFVICELNIDFLRRLFHEQRQEWLMKQEAKPMTSINSTITQTPESVIYMSSTSPENMFVPKIEQKVISQPMEKLNEICKIT